jgi:hypothetical protein
MNFIITPIGILKDEKPLPSMDYFFNAFLDNGNIPIAIIQDEEHELWKSILATKPPHLELKYIVLTITYLQKFEA